MKRDERVLLATQIEGIPISNEELKSLEFHLGVATLSYDEYSSFLVLLENLSILEDEFDLTFKPDNIIEELETIYGKLESHKPYTAKDKCKFGDLPKFKHWLFLVEIEESKKYNFLLPHVNLGYNLDTLDKVTILRLADYLERIGCHGNRQLDEILEKLLEE